MLQKRKKWMTTAGTAVVLLAISLTFAFKSPTVASAPPAPEYYWSYNGTGSIEDVNNYTRFSSNSIPGYALAAFCPTGNDQVCVIEAPDHPWINDRPYFDDSTRYFLHVINTGQTTSTSLGKIRLKSNN